METPISKPFLESDLYQNPRQAFDVAVAKLDLGNGAIAYFNQLLASDDSKSDTYQKSVKPILENLLKAGNPEEAGLLFNIHRILTEFSGYGANENVSDDVVACFGKDFEIPEQGLIVVDFFVTRNLPKIIEVCKERGIDLSRIRVCAPKAILAVQLMKMTDEKRAEFEQACLALNEDQFIVPDVNHNADITVDGLVAIWFSPRTMPITPKLHAETEKATIENFCGWFREKISTVVQGGRAYANLAYSNEHHELFVEEFAGKRLLTRLPGISKATAREIMNCLVAELGFVYLGKGTFDPDSVNPNNDNAKLALELHVVKR